MQMQPHRVHQYFLLAGNLKEYHGEK